MRSSAEFQPTEGAHIRQSTVCATCHTLYTKALNPQGQVIGVLPEQVMYLEWKHSAFPGEEASCQSCHMPTVSEEMPIPSVLGQPRKLPDGDLAALNNSFGFGGHNIALLVRST